MLLMSLIWAQVISRASRPTAIRPMPMIPCRFSASRPPLSVVSSSRPTTVSNSKPCTVSALAAIFLSLVLSLLAEHGHADCPHHRAQQQEDPAEQDRKSVV